MSQKTKRPYNKKSSYWQDRKARSANAQGKSSIAVSVSDQMDSSPFIDFENAKTGDPYMASSASCKASRSALYRGQSNPLENGYFSQQNFVNLKSGRLPYSVKNGSINISEAVELCQRAYANVAIFRNTVDIMTEFSNSNLHLRGGNEASRLFFTKWFEKVGLYKLKEQFFREYYKSGNIFIQKIKGEFSSSDFIKLREGVLSVKNEIPLRYYILNPASIGMDGGLSYEFPYSKVVSNYELDRIRNPRTDEDKAVRNSIDKKTLKIIDNGNSMSSDVLLPLSPEDVSFVFYKKQGYEPFAIPMGFPVLNDIEYKLQLKKMDMALTRTVENIILLVTMGNEPDKGGINRANIKSLQDLLSNQAAGRVIVADYTTKAQFVIPDLKEILGSAKYEVVNNDINEGLQNIVLGSEKFANQFIKTKVFLERLNEGQEAFINEFLYPEMKVMAQNMGFRTCPVPVFEKIDLKDEIQFARVVTRLAEVGIFTAEQVLETLESGLYPDKNEMVKDQEEYKVLRDKGLYNPLLGGNNQSGNEGGRPDGAKAPQTTKTVSPLGSGKAKEERKYSAKAIAETYGKFSELTRFSEKLIKEKHSVKKLNKEQKNIVEGIVKSVVAQNQFNKWEDCVAEFINNKNIICDDKVSNSILEIQAELDLPDAYSASAMYHSSNFEEVTSDSNKK